jgi:tetratricopeptide (TPR) repeat protein
LFFRAQEQFQNGDLENAAETFAATEAEMERFPEMFFQALILARARYGWCLYYLERPDRALEVFDRAIASIERIDPTGVLDEFRTRRPNEIPHIHWGRARALESLRRSSAALEAIPALIEEVGSGATETQRSYVAGAYLLQARVAEKRGRFDVALRAIDEATAQCAGGNEPELKAVLHDAEQMQRALRARVQAR